MNAVHRWRLNPDLPTILVVGGAQGAEVINRAVLGSMDSLLARCNVLHQAGTGRGLTTTAATLAARAESLGSTQGIYLVSEFFDAEELGDAYAVACLAIGRSGAGTTNELAANKIPAILVPLVPTGGDEQRKIADHLRVAGAALIVPSEDLNGVSLRTEVFGSG